MKSKLIILIMIIFLTSGCGNKFEGYWCNYEETSTIVVLLEKEHTDKQKQKIEATIEDFENVESMNFFTREDYAIELGQDPNTIDIYDTYVVSFSSMDYIGSYVEELNELAGVVEAKQSNAKSNISLYNIDKNKKYTFTDSDEAEESDLIKGKYKIKNGVIIFTPEDKKQETSMLYIKDGHLCGDASCSKIYAKSNETCSSK